MLGAMSVTGVILAAAALTPLPGPAGVSWEWPLRPPPMVLRGFDPPAHPWEPGHRGADLAARPGQPVYAAGPGRVGFAGDLAGRGVVTVVHGTLRTTYLPVRPAVRAGQIVAAGTRIGRVERATGHCGEISCLHWGLLRGTTYLDPLALLGLGRVRLLPWWGAPDGGGAAALRAEARPDEPTPVRAGEGRDEPTPVRSAGAGRAVGRRDEPALGRSAAAHVRSGGAGFAHPAPPTAAGAAGLIALAGLLARGRGGLRGRCGRPARTRGRPPEP